ncbi:MAG: hypothetical protein K5770_17020 [Lachnospiraceae bacterium]|nr:hypothetical protein [Lachnospiraceae bacterium]
MTVENTQEAKKAEQTPQGKEKKDRPADTLPEEKAVVHIEKASPATKEEPEERKTTEAAEAPKVKEAVKEEAAPEKKEAVPEKKEAVPEKKEAVPEKKEAAKEEADGGTKDSIKAEAAEGSSEAKKEDKVDITSDTGSDTETDREKADDKDEEDEDYYFDEKPVFSGPPKEMGFVAVSSGEGLQAIFRGLGVDYVITGGQTMNPSTEDMLYAIDRVNAKNIFILPNNKNIIMAANQAQYMAEDKKIIVIPTKTVPQGITALINYSMDASAEDNEKLMNEEIKKVKTGQVTYAVRDTMISDMEIKQGNIMGIGDDDILAVGTIVEDTAMEMLEKMVDEDSELICIYYGNEVDEEAADDFLHEVEEKFPDCDVELHAGGQPIYYYIVSVE